MVKTRALCRVLYQYNNSISNFNNFTVLINRTYTLNPPLHKKSIGKRNTIKNARPKCLIFNS